MIITLRSTYTMGMTHPNIYW